MAFRPSVVSVYGSATKEYNKAFDEFFGQDTVEVDRPGAKTQVNKSTGKSTKAYFTKEKVHDAVECVSSASGAASMLHQSCLVQLCGKTKLPVAPMKLFKNYCLMKKAVLMKSVFFSSLLLQPKTHAG